MGEILQTDLDRTKADLAALDTKQKKLQADYEHQQIITEEIRKENIKIKQETDTRESEVKHMQTENKKLQKANEQILRKITHLESTKTDLDGERESLRRQAYDLEKRLEAQQTQTMSDRKIMEELLRDRDSIKRNLDKQNTDTEKLDGQITAARLEKHALELEIQRYAQEAVKSKRILANLEKERDKNAATLNALKHEVADMTTTLGDKEGKITDLKRQNDETEAKTQTVRNQLETMRTERNILSKSVS